MGRILTLDEAIQQRRALKAAGLAVVLTNGHFDLLHAGHLDYLERARALGDALFVGVNGDTSTRRLKGPGRPLIPAAERARLVAALTPVSAAIVFEDDTADGLIEALQPEIYAKGGDYAQKNMPETVTCEQFGARVVLIDFLPDHSTSALIARIRALPEAK